MIVAELFAKLGLVPDQRSWDKGHELVESMHHALEAYLGYEGLKKVGELVEGTVKAAVEAKHLGERLGVTGEAVQELGYAADVTGASAEEMATAMQRLAFGMENARRTGSGPLVDALYKLHIPFSQISKLPMDQRLERIADGFAKAGPNVDKLALSMELFGRNAGPKLLPLLNKGSAGIQELRAEAEKLGVVIDEEGIQKAEEFEIAQKKLGATLKGIRNEAVVAMLPALQEMADGLREWVSENREAIASTLEAVLKGLAFAFHLVGAAISFVTDLIKEHKDVVEAVLIGLGALITAFAVQAAIDWVIAFWPLVLVVAIIAAVALAIKKLWDWISNGNDIVARTIRGAISWFRELMHHVADVLGEIKDGFEAAFDWVINLPVIKQLIQLVKDLKDFAGKPKGSEGAHAALAGTRAGAANDFLNEHPFLASFLGGGNEQVRRTVQAENFGGGDQEININGDTHISVDASGMDPKEAKEMVKDAMKEHTDDLLRSAHQNLAGGKR